MVQRTRVPLWYALPLAMALAIGLLIGRYVFGSESAERSSASLGEAAIPKGGATQGAFTPSPLGTAIPTPVAEPSPTAAPTVRPTPAKTALNSILTFGEPWRGERLWLLAEAPVREQCVLSTNGLNCYPHPVVTFTVENRSGTALHFEAASGQFALELSTGRRYLGTGQPGVFDELRPGTIAFSSFSPGTRQRFTIPFSPTWEQFKRDLLDPALTHYTLVVRDFSSDILTARWQEDIHH